MNPEEARIFIRRAWRVHLDTAAYKLDAIQRLGLTPNDVRAIATLADFGPMSASELTARLGVTSGAGTGIADRLIKANVATRQVDPRDKRRHIISLHRSDIDDIFGDLTGPALKLLQTYTKAERRTITKYYGDLDRLIHPVE